MTDWKLAGTGVWVREYKFRGNPVNSTAIDMGDGGLMVISPGTNVPEEDYVALDALGPVKALVSPGAFHNVGLPAWSARYPEAGLYGPTSAIAHIAKQHPTLKPLQSPDALRPLLSPEFDLGEVASCKHPDLFLALTRDGQTTWFTNEVLTNSATYPSSLVFGFLFRITGNHPGLNVNSLAAMLIGAKKPLVRTYLEEKLASVRPTRLVPTHGVVLEDVALGDKIAEVLARRF